MFPLLIPAAVGAVGGALMNKDKPLKGALLGAGLGAAGGAAAPAIGGLLGGGASAGAAAGASSAAAPAAGFGLGQPLVAGGLGEAAIAGSAPASSSGLLGTIAKYKPALDAAATGVQMSGAMDQQAPVEAPAPMQVQGGAEALAGIASQTPAATLQADQSERARRRAALRGGV